VVIDLRPRSIFIRVLGTQGILVYTLYIKLALVMPAPFVYADARPWLKQDIIISEPRIYDISIGHPFPCYMEGHVARPGPIGDQQRLVQIYGQEREAL
jgi:hypothetical protein